VNTIFSWRLSCLISLTALAVVGSGLSAQAETIKNTNPGASGQKSTSVAGASWKQTGTVSPSIITSAAALKGETSIALPRIVSQTNGTTPDTTTPSQTQPNLITPGNAPGPTAPNNNPGNVEPLSKTTGGSSYVGIAGNIGLSGGETALGVGSFTLISKVGLLRNISIRPTAVIGDNNTVLIPLTYDFSLQRQDVLSRAFRIAPYIGAGIAINTGNNSDTGALITAGVDVPLTPQFTANAALNVGFVNNTSIGLLVGIGYNFSGLPFGL